MSVGFIRKALLMMNPKRYMSLMKIQRFINLQRFHTKNWGFSGWEVTPFGVASFFIKANGKMLTKHFYM